MGVHFNPGPLFVSIGCMRRAAKSGGGSPDDDPSAFVMMMLMFTMIPLLAVSLIFLLDWLFG